MNMCHLVSSEKDPQRSNDILASLREYLAALPFSFQNASIITGQEEGLYGWITVNYLMGNFLEVRHGASKVSKRDNQDCHLSCVITFAEESLERLRASGRGEDSGVHGPGWSIHSDRLRRPGQLQWAWLHARQTVRLPLQRLHTQLPLLRQERGREDGYGQDSEGAPLVLSLLWMSVFVWDELLASELPVSLYTMALCMLKCTWQSKRLHFCTHRQTRIH